jgi:hypothetical protein
MILNSIAFYDFELVSFYDFDSIAFYDFELVSFYDFDLIPCSFMLFSCKVNGTQTPEAMYS